MNIPKDSNGATPIHDAARHGHFQIYKMILDVIEDTNPKDNNGKTPFHLAAQKGDFASCQLIIGIIDDKNPTDDWERTPLHHAAEYGHKEIYQLIIMKIKDNKNPKDIDGWTPLQLAAKELKRVKENENKQKFYSIIEIFYDNVKDADIDSKPPMTLDLLTNMVKNYVDKTDLSIIHKRIRSNPGKKPRLGECSILDSANENYNLDANHSAEEQAVENDSIEIIDLDDDNFESTEDKKGL